MRRQAREPRATSTAYRSMVSAFATGPSGRVPWAGWGQSTQCLSSVRTCAPASRPTWRSEEHTSELQSLMRISYAVFCLKKKKKKKTTHTESQIESDRQIEY